MNFMAKDIQLKITANCTDAFRLPIYRGLKIVHGVPLEIKPISGAPLGKYRLRLRAKDVAKLFVKTATGIRALLLEDKGDSWLARPDLWVSENERHVRRRAWLPGADIRKFKGFSFV